MRTIAKLGALIALLVAGCGGGEPVTPMPGPCGNVSSVPTMSVSVAGTVIDDGEGWCVEATPEETTITLLLDDPTQLRLALRGVDAGAGTYTCAFGDPMGITAELTREATFAAPTDDPGAEITFVATTMSANRGTTSCTLTWSGFPAGGGAATGTFEGTLSRWNGVYGTDGQPVREYAEVSATFSVEPPAAL